MYAVAKVLFRITISLVKNVVLHYGRIHHTLADRADELRADPLAVLEDFRFDAHLPPPPTLRFFYQDPTELGVIW